MNTLYIAIDFDGTMTRHENKDGGRTKFPEIGIENVSACHYVKALMEMDHVELTLLTMREDEPLHMAVRWCAERGVYWDSINECHPVHFTHPVGRKVYADILVDDLAFGCPLIHFRGRRRPCVDWSRVGPALWQSAKNGHSWQT